MHACCKEDGHQAALGAERYQAEERIGAIVGICLQPGNHHAGGFPEQDRDAKQQGCGPRVRRGLAQQQEAAHQQVAEDCTTDTQRKRMREQLVLLMRRRRRHQPWHDHLATADQRYRRGDQDHGLGVLEVREPFGPQRACQHGDDADPRGHLDAALG